MAVAARPSSGGGKGKGRAIEPAFEYYDIEESDTFAFGEKTICGFYKNVTFNDCIRQDTNFKCCTFINVTFENCTFKDTNFLNLYLRDVSFTGIEFDENTWMNDRLEHGTVTVENFKTIFPKQSQVGCIVPFEVIDADFLQMQLALTDDSYIQLDEDLARRLQFEEDSQPVPHRPCRWTKAHGGYDAGVVTGVDKHGFPKVEHPSFSSWAPTSVETIDISGGIPTTRTEGHSAVIMRNMMHKEKEAQPAETITLSKQSTSDETLPPHVRCAMAKRRVRDAARALGDQSTVDSSSSSAKNHGTGNSRLVNNVAAPSLTRQVDTNSGSALKQHDGKVRGGETPKVSPSRHFRLGYQERRDKEVASAAKLQATARVQSEEEVARIAAWNHATLAAARATDERQARERMSATIVSTRSAAEIAAITKNQKAGSTNISGISNPGQPPRTAPVTKPRTNSYVTTEMASRTKSKVGAPEPVRSLHAAPNVDTPMNAPSVTDLFGDGTKSARRVFRLAGSSDNTPRIFNSSSGSATVSNATQAEDTPESATVAGGGFGSDGGVRLPGSPLFKTGWDGDENLIEL
ncbi:hypothetical protein LTR56_018507 [Elasticomyces elasticus]|nr:hypothetical protein LTR56_018507 [Elasticomyces elasticus]KAK3636488.1 hypothetical protein LTR22_018721 [Elasticomyces elasticus]KAK4920169.1 hypothetical protein LTR49_012268 [Elasticomyces elasticus]KAK5751684.1 hypothetical protein LTS12_018213 [Elasticomyces elasticus]